jgi:hypothetical protein
MDMFVDTELVYYETMTSLYKMLRMVLPFLGDYRWVHKDDPIVTGKRPSFDLSSFLS